VCKNEVSLRKWSVGGAMHLRISEKTLNTDIISCSVTSPCLNMRTATAASAYISSRRKMRSTFEPRIWDERTYKDDRKKQKLHEKNRIQNNLLPRNQRTQRYLLGWAQLYTMAFQGANLLRLRESVSWQESLQAIPI